MLTLIEPTSHHETSRAAIATRAPEPDEPRLVGDADLASMLDAVRALLGLGSIAAHLVDAHGCIGQLVAAAGSVPPVEEVGPARRLDLDEVGPWAGLWLRTGGDQAETHVVMLAPRVRDRIALLSRPLRQDIAGRLGLEQAIGTFRPLIERTIGQWAKSHVHKARLREQEAVFDTLGSGLLVVDADCHVHMSNAAAHALALPGIMSLRNDRLVIAHLDDAMRFQVMLQRALTLDGSTGDTAIAALRRGSAAPLLLAITGLRAAGSGMPLATVQIIDPQAELALPLETLSRHYDLTQAEGRLIEQLVRGKTLAEAARTLRLKEQTARTYLKHIFQKTGLRRQVELIRVVLAGAVPSLCAA